MGQALRDCGLANARLADQGRVVLRLPTEDLDDPLDLLLTSDHGVELSGACGLGQVDTELVDGRRLARALGLLGPGAGGRALGQDADDFVAHLVEVDPQRLEHAGCDALTLPDKAQQKMLRADVVVPKSAGFIDRQFDDTLGARRESDLTDDRSIATPDDEFDRGSDLGQLHVHVFQHSRRHALALADKTQEQVLCPDVVVVEPLRFVLSQCQDLAGSVRELVETIHEVERLFFCEASRGWRVSHASTTSGEARQCHQYGSVREGFAIDTRSDAVHELRNRNDPRSDR